MRKTLVPDKQLVYVEESCNIFLSRTIVWFSVLIRRPNSCYYEIKYACVGYTITVNYVCIVMNIIAEVKAQLSKHHLENNDAIFK